MALDILQYLKSIGQLPHGLIDLNSDNVKTKKCVFCGAEGKCYVYYKTRSFVCYKAKCKQAGDFAKYVSKVEGISFKKAKLMVDGVKEYNENSLFNMSPIESPVDERDFLAPVEIPPDFEEINKDHYDAIDYLSNKRGISLSLAQEIGMYVSEKRKRVIFPVEWAGEIVGYIARDYSNEAETKVLNSRGKFRRAMMFNYNRVRNLMPKQVVIVEGAIDAIKCGLDRSVAILGVKMTEDQADLIKDLKPEEIIIFLDAGYLEDSNKIAELFKYTGSKISIVSMPKIYKANGDVLDSGDLTTQQADDIIKKHSTPFHGVSNKQTSLFGKLVK